MPTFFGPVGSDAFNEFLAQFLQGQRATGRPIDITRFLSRRTTELMGRAARFAREHGHSEVDSLHILRALLDETSLHGAFRAVRADRKQIAKSLEQRLPADGEQTTDAPSLTGAAQRALLDAYQAARAFGSTYIDPEHLFWVFVANQDAPAGQVLAQHGVTPQALQTLQATAEDRGVSTGSTREGGVSTSSTGEGSSTPETPTLDEYSIDLTARAREGALDPVIGRAEEIEQTIEILSRRTKNNPVLIGEAGVGKTAIVDGLAQAIVDGTVPEQLRDKRVVSLDLAGMLSGTRYRGDFEERLTNVMDEISAHPDVIVFVDELHTIVGAGGSGDAGGMDAGNILKPRLARGELHLIGATTLKEYRRIEKDPALERRFQPVHVGEPSVDDAVQILLGLRERYEQHHGLRYTDEAIRAAVELSHRYVTDRFLPDKAIDLIDQAGARMRLRSGVVAAPEQTLAELEEAKNQAVADERYEDASALRDRIEKLTAAPAGQLEVTEREIAEVISRATGIPAARLTEDDRSRLARLEGELHERVIGQDDAVTAIAKSIRRSRTGLGDPNRPVGSFLFLGPTGVGKTELAKSLAKSLFGDEKRMLRYDMSEFGERHTVSRLVGAPPGYVGYDEAGQLTEQVRRNPYSVVLLDEIEKAHPDVFNLLLQVLDDGRLTDGQGRTVDFRNTVIIMTSNLGSEFLASRTGNIGFAAPGEQAMDVRARVMGKVREAMRPEFINRIDEIVLFQKLDREQLRDIVRLQLARSTERLAAQGIELSVSDEAIDWIANAGYEPEYGARPLRRVIQREVDDRIAELLVAGGLAAGDRAVVTARDGELAVTGERAAMAA
ncbi:ATP-dependent Clp protease ATP-binding subunit [Salinibacterium sp. dk2585]|uniref:ATP-dependent Clp protease ATP-binding subunit n=1 Tax=unclassified Salinibacterium TaxID=2632331 RepID=UPI0011C24968|nr:MULTISPECIES: ATP-dependent Clp protease ATP-binding subunit [unclassified Salinibacterium]QEE62022.1 ATP-dependent Clp protease ATP-binding subunit [Salinibacterium sp. dk2585]TXK54423.1 ATP-dependent Clp protease ATP-binding subunit [Salinibacterium sp. dk5596]